MAKQESKGPTRPDPRAQARRRRLELVSAGLFASFLVAGLLTLDLLPVSTLGLVGLPREGDISDRDYKAPDDVTIEDVEATELRDRLIDHVLRRLEVADIIGIGDGLAAGGPNLIDDLLGGARVGANPVP